MTEAWNAQRRVRTAIWQAEIDELKMNTGCQWPGGCENVIDIPSQLEFAHLDHLEKEFNISRFLGSRSPFVAENRERLEAEIAKCKILCLLHHRFETAASKVWSYRRGTNPEPA